ncbi:MAG: SigB/SigF/SigG family RNA polymerase sigma factor [Armatimonadota bacterium]
MNESQLARRDNKTATTKDTKVLFLKYAKTHDPSIRDHLVLCHQNLVRYLAGKFVNRGIPLEDLVQVGNIGLINAVDRFDPERGLQFSTYATPTIVGEIRRYFRDKGWSMKVPRRLQELNQAAAKASDQISAVIGRSPTIPEIAAKIGASEEETLEAIEMGNMYDTMSIDSLIPSNGESAQLTLAEFFGKKDASIQNIESYADLRQAIDSLDPRESAVIYYRYFEDLSQTQVAERLNISQMHVSRLQTKALVKLKGLLGIDGLPSEYAE